MILWIGATLVASSLIALGAWVADYVAARCGIPHRYGWATAMLVAVAVPTIAGTRPRHVVLPAAGGQMWAPPTALFRDVRATSSDTAVLTASAVYASLKQWTNVRRAANATSGMDGWALAVWAALSLAMLLRLVAGVLFVRRERHKWIVINEPVGPVFVAASAGPAVTGVCHPQIVIPRWLLEEDAVTRALLLRHEVEHVRAGDTRLLFGAAVLHSLTPWNVPLGWMLRRLRLAIEIDCDRRVIDAVGGARRYGLAVLAASERFAAPLPMSARLHESRLQLEARINAMTQIANRKPIAGALSVAGLGLIVVAACGSMPWPALGRPSRATAPLAVSSTRVELVSASEHVDAIGEVSSSSPVRAHSPNRAVSVVMNASSFGRAPQAPARAEQAAMSQTQDSILAIVVSGDSATQITLTDHQIVYTFTQKGAERIERTATALPDSDDSGWMSGLIRYSVRGAVAGMRMVFAVSDVASVRYANGTLRIDFKSRLGANASERGNTFSLERVNQNDGETFAQRFAGLNASGQ